MLESCLHEVFAARVAEAPDRVALTAPDGVVTYQELDLRAESVAQALRVRGVGPDVLVGLCCEPGVALIAGMLGILKAGGAYVAIDPAYPEQRRRFLLDDSGVKLVVAAGAGLKAMSGNGLETLDVFSVPAVDTVPASMPGCAPTHLAYLIYTSGSSGTPKGVAVEHRQVTRLLASTQEWFGFGAQDVWTLFHSASFDFSVWEIWGALAHGGRLVVVPRSATRAPAHLWQLLRSEQVTVLSQTPSAFRQLLAVDFSADPGMLRYIVFGGERLDVSLLRPWIDRHGDERPQLINMYGITETTVHVTFRRVVAADLARPRVSPIGVPLRDWRVSLRDGRGEPVPAGQPGEMWVAGAGLARGYHGRPGLTAERFVTSEGERWYRSGDRAVSDADGQLSYLGRIDDQIKVRGYRIEPGEVETCLAAHQAVGGAVALPQDRGDGDVSLVAYIQPIAGEEGDALEARLRAWAAERLPAYLRPSDYRIISEIPLTAQGKVDRSLLLTLGGAVPSTHGVNEDVATQVARAVASVLQRDVPPDADIFDLGATSLAYVRIIATLNKQFGISLTGSELDEIASVEALTAATTAVLAQRSATTV